MALRGIAHGRFTIVDGRVGLKLSHITLFKTRRDIGGSGHAVEVGYSGSDHAGFKAVGVGHSPRSHEAAEAPAAYGQARGIADALGDEIVYASHDVREVAATPILKIGFGEADSLPFRPSRIGKQNDVAMGSEHGGVVVPIAIEAHHPCFFRAAVDVDDGLVPCAGLIAG